MIAMHSSTGRRPPTKRLQPPRELSKSLPNSAMTLEALRTGDLASKQASCASDEPGVSVRDRAKKFASGAKKPARRSFSLRSKMTKQNSLSAIGELTLDDDNDCGLGLPPDTGMKRPSFVKSSSTRSWNSNSSCHGGPGSGNAVPSIVAAGRSGRRSLIKSASQRSMSTSLRDVFNKFETPVHETKVVAKPLKTEVKKEKKTKIAQTARIFETNEKINKKQITSSRFAQSLSTKHTPEAQKKILAQAAKRNSKGTLEQTKKLVSQNVQSRISSITSLFESAGKRTMGQKIVTKMRDSIEASAREEVKQQTLNHYVASVRASAKSNNQGLVKKLGGKPFVKASKRKSMEKKNDDGLTRSRPSSLRPGTHCGQSFGDDTVPNSSDKQSIPTKRPSSLRPGSYRGESFGGSSVCSSSCEDLQEEQTRFSASRCSLRPGSMRGQSFGGSSACSSSEDIEQQHQGEEERPSPKFSLRPGSMRGMSFGDDSMCSSSSSEDDFFASPVRSCSVSSLRPGMQRGLSIVSDNDVSESTSSPDMDFFSLRPSIHRGLSIVQDENDCRNRDYNEPSTSVNNSDEMMDAVMIKIANAQHEAQTLIRTVNSQTAQKQVEGRRQPLKRRASLGGSRRVGLEYASRPTGFVC